MHTKKSIKPLPASQTSARGPHPPLQLLDEVDEMEKKVYDASLGQAMEQLNAHGHLIEEYIVASSHLAEPGGHLYRGDRGRPGQRALPVFTWCWRELLQPHGWMSQRFIDAKRNTVSAQMWHTEYELNEPNAGCRALDLDKVEKFFVGRRHARSTRRTRATATGTSTSGSSRSPAGCTRSGRTGPRSRTRRSSRWSATTSSRAGWSS